MTRSAERAHRLTAPQAREIAASDPVTGRVGGGAALRAALVAKGLAVTYGRVGDTYLTAAGLAVREELRRAEVSAGAPPAAKGPDDGGFVPATGDTPPPTDAAARAAEVARAWTGLAEIRRLTGSPGAPAAWERSRPERAVALTLEALGVPPCVTGPNGRRIGAGYHVGPGGEAGDVRVEWRGPASSPAREEAAARLSECAALLSRYGWEATMFLGAGGVRYLAVAPAR